MTIPNTEPVNLDIFILGLAITILEQWAEDHEDPKWAKHNQSTANMILEILEDREE